MPFQPKQDRPMPSARAQIVTGNNKPEPTKQADPERVPHINKRQHPTLDVISLKNYNISPTEVARLLFG